MATRVSVVGAGSWGTTVATITAARVPTVLWARRAELAIRMAADHVNPDYLPGIWLPEQLVVTSSLEEALSGADLVAMAVPSHGFRDILTQAAPFMAPGVPVLSLAKGLELGSLKRMTVLIGEAAPGHPTAVLTGPNLAREVMAGHPAASVVAAGDPTLATELQDLLSHETFRVYTNPDVVGCELAGALKNVMAIASGMGDGMGFGDNTRAALMTRGLAEMTRLGVALGGDPLTFSGLAGMGDLAATCMSHHSRNRHVGEALGRGSTPEQIVADMRMVAEGIKTSKAVVELAGRCGVDVPIAEQVVAVLHGGHRARDVIPALMGRVARAEWDGTSATRSRQRAQGATS